MIIKKIIELFKRMNEEGIYIPLARDHKIPSVSLTLLFISSLFVILGLLSGTIPGLNVSFWESLSWYVTSAVLYYNRGAKISKQGFEITNNDTPKGE